MLCRTRRSATGHLTVSAPIENIESGISGWLGVVRKGGARSSLQPIRCVQCALIIHGKPQRWLIISFRIEAIMRCSGLESCNRSASLAMMVKSSAKNGGLDIGGVGKTSQPQSSVPAWEMRFFRA
jgi:hypothetical protein